MNPSFDLTDDQKAKALESIKLFFSEYRDENLGDLAAMLVFDFIVERFGPYFYNIGVMDAKVFLQDKLEDLFSLEK